MSLKYRDKNGAEVVLAGLTPGGDIEYGAVATRTGTTEVITIQPNSFALKTITFSEPMPDNDYLIELEIAQQTRLNTTVYAHYDSNKTANGFQIWICNPMNAEESVAIKWTAFKLYTVADAEQLMSTVNDISAMIPSTASSTNKFSTADDLRTETRALDRRLDDVEDVIPTSASVTNQLATRADLDNVTIDELGDIQDVDVSTVTDGQTIIWDDANSKWVNGQGGKVYTAGNGINISGTDEISTNTDNTSVVIGNNKELKVANTYKTIFVGTRAQWDALSTADKVKYNEAHITDDVIGGEVADEVTDGLMSPVTSNAVYDALIMVPKFIGTTLLADVSGNSSTTYTATQDCWVTGWLTYNSKLGGHNPTIRIGGTTGPVVATAWSNGYSSESEGLSMYVPVCFPLKKNQTAYFIQTNTSATPGRQIFNCKVYAMFS